MRRLAPPGASASWSHHSSERGRPDLPRRMVAILQTRQRHLRAGMVQESERLAQGSAGLCGHGQLRFARSAGREGAPNAKGLRDGTSRASIRRPDFGLAAVDSTELRRCIAGSGA